ncbi:Uncharacterised protein [Mycobacteroides abscessus subsp. abscessus]|nr:Uncharacterised protein [Mycobacteroides abscessus subsp. abscessus]
MQTVTQLDRHQRVRAQVQEPAGGSRRLRQAQEVLHLTLQELGHEARPLRHRNLHELLEQLTVTGHLTDGTGQHQIQDRWPRAAQHLGGTLPIRLQDGRLSGAIGHHLGQRRKRRRGIQRNQALGTDVRGRRLRRRHAALTPRTEVDTRGRQTLRPALRDQTIEQRIGRRVVGLAGRTEQAGHRGRHDEEVQIVTLGQPVQILRPECLGRQRCPEPFHTLLTEQRIVEHTGQMCHARQRRQFRTDPLQEPRDLGLRADIGGEHVDARLGALGDLPDHALRIGVGRTTAGQHDVPGTQLSQVGRGVQTDRAEATGDQIGPIRPRCQRIRHLAHDLADMPGLLHAAERRPGLRQRVDLGGQRRPLSLGQSLGDLGEQDPDAVRLLEHHRVQRDNLVGDVGPGLRHLLRGPNIALGDLGEATVLGGGAQGRLDEALAGEAVEHHIHTRAVGVRQDLIGEIGCTRVVHILHAELAQCRPLEGAGRGEHLGPELLGHLNGRQPDTATGGVNQHLVTRLELRPVERQSHRERGSGNRGGLDPTDPVRNRRQELSRHVEAAAEGALHGAVDPLAHLHSGDTFTQLRDDAGEVTADRSRITRIQPQHVEHVAEVETRGLHPHLHVTLVRRRHLLLGDPQVVDGATLGGRQDVVAAARHRQMPGARPRQQPGSQQFTLPHRDFRLIHRGDQQPRQRLHGLRRPVAVDELGA